MTDVGQQANWQTRLIQPRWGRKVILPADVVDALQTTMFSREAILEDANYQKVVPNHFIVEVSPESYALSYQPIAQRVEQQWAEKLLEHLMTINSRVGRREYAFGGRLQIEVRSGNDLSAAQVRIHYRIEPNHQPNTPRETLPATACLEHLSSGVRHLLRLSTMTLGRATSNDIRVDTPDVVAQRLISGKHAYIRREGNTFILHDGSTDGRPSLNGTYLNGQRVPAQGIVLKEGDLIVLASVLPDQPDPNAPGVASFRFRRDCA